MLSQCVWDAPVISGFHQFNYKYRASMHRHMTYKDLLDDLDNSYLNTSERNLPRCNQSNATVTP